MLRTLFIFTFASLFILLPFAACAQEGTANSQNAAVDAASASSKISIFKDKQRLQVTLNTSAGPVQCSLFAGEHQAAAANFVSLSSGRPAWTDESGKLHSEPYFKQLPFEKKAAGVFVASGIRSEGTNFVLPDGRCQEHQPAAGALIMLHPWPGQASAQFMILAKDMPIFRGMYEVFGSCDVNETLQKLTREDAILESVKVNLE